MADQQIEHKSRSVLSVRFPVLTTSPIFLEFSWTSVKFERQ